MSAFPTADINSFLTSQITGTMTVKAWTVSPDVDGVGGTEVSAAGYVQGSHAAWTTASAKSIANNGDIELGDSTGEAWGSVVAVTLHHTDTTQKALLVGSKTISIDVDRVYIASGDAVLSFS